MSETNWSGETSSTGPRTRWTFYFLLFIFNLFSIFFYKVDFVADQLTYWPPEIKLFSTSGCKRVAQKVDLMLEDMEDNVPVSKNEL